MKHLTFRVVRNMATKLTNDPALMSNPSRSWTVKQCVSRIQQCKSLRDLEVISLSVEHDRALSTNLFVKTALLNRYSNHSQTISKCVSIFNSIANDHRDIVIICSMMNAFIKHHQSTNALLLFDTVKNSALLIGPNDRKLSYFYSLAIKASIRCNDRSKGMSKGIEIHCLLKGHYPELYQNHFINTSLITFYGHFGDTESAVTVFRDSIHFNVASLNALMTVLTEHRLHQNALEIYSEFEREHGMKYDDITHLLALKLCINTNDQRRGQQIVDKIDIDQCSVEMRNSLIDFHGHFKDLRTAMNLFYGMNDSLKTEVTMTVMLKAMISNNSPKTALKLYGDDRYQHLIECPDSTPLHLLAVRGCIVSNRYKLGMDIISKQQIRFDADSKNELFVKSTLIDFYGHFGSIQMAMDIFESIPRDKMVGVHVSCIMKALINNEWYTAALRVYDEYQSNVQYDNVTHVLALKATKNVNEWERGKRIHFEGLDPYLSSDCSLNRYDFNVVISSLIDFYGHFGDIDTAINLFRAHFIDGKASRNRMNLCAVNAMLNVYLENEMYSECIHLFETVNQRMDRWRIRDRDAVEFDDLKIFYSTALKCCTDGMMIECGMACCHCGDVEMAIIGVF